MDTCLTLTLANRIVTAVLQKGSELHLKPLTVAVLDRGGHLVALQRQDGASILRPQIASGKAYGALALGVSSRAVAAMASERPSFIAALGPLADRGIVPVAGGILIAGPDGDLIGAVGVSGDASDNDEICAMEGIRAAGLVAMTGP